MRLAEQGAPKAMEALREMAYYLGAGIALLITGLAPDVIIIVGELTRAWNQIGPVIERASKAVASPTPGRAVIPTDPATQPRLRGTIALVLQKHFGAPLVA